MLLLLILMVQVAAKETGIEWPTTTASCRPKTNRKDNYTYWLKLQRLKVFSVERFCETLVPPFGVKPQNTRSPYNIEYSRRPLRVCIRVLGNDTVKWQGFAFQVRHQGAPIGRFYMNSLLSDNLTYRFGCNYDSGRTHSGHDTIYRYAPNYFRKLFVWWSPPSNSNTNWTINYNYTLYAVMIREFPTFWLHTIPLELHKKLDFVKMTSNHLQNDPLPTTPHPPKETWIQKFKFALLILFKNVLYTLRLYEPSLAKL